MLYICKSKCFKYAIIGFAKATLSFCFPYDIVCVHENVSLYFCADNFPLQPSPKPIEITIFLIFKK